MRKNKLLLLLALLMTAATGAWAQSPVDGTIAWPVGNEASATVSASIKDAISSTGVTTGSGLTVESATYLATDMVKYTPTTANAGNVSGVMIEYRIETVDGFKFKPTGVDYAAVKVGNDNLSYSWSYTIDGAESAITDVSKDDLLRSNGNNSATAQLMHSESITADGCSVFTLRFYISNCGTTKNICIGNITISGSVSAAPADYTVSLKDGVKDADKWTISPNPAPEGSPVTIQYNGRLKVKGVTATSDAAPAGKTVDLSTLTAGYEAKDGETLTGTLANNVKVSIADGATVTLKDVNITNLGENCDWAGINCPGNATLVLEGTNEVCAGRDGSGYNNYPGIYIASGKTLTIQGAGTLTAYSNASNPFAAGIGGGYGIACGNIVINSGTITATGGNDAAGIGGGNEASCGNITISGGTVEARGGGGGAGIGGGYYASCGNIEISGGTVSATGGDCAAGIGGGINNGACGTITITSGVTSVTATKGEYAPNSIGSGDNGTAITVTIGGVEGAITTSPYTYEPTAAAKPAATVTTAPTGAAIVGVGKTTALVSGGAADGGTLWYAVTTTNTKPTSTAGFSDAVPTAKDITASGKVYVWYYVKGDDTHSDSEIAATAIEVPVADIVWDRTNISNLGVFEGAPYDMDGVTMSSNAGNVFATWTDNGDPTSDGIEFQAYESGGYTFTAPAGKAFTKIEMKALGSDEWEDSNLGTGWAYNSLTVTWKGTAAASTVDLLKDDDYFEGALVKSIVFYLSDAE